MCHYHGYHINRILLPRTRFPSSSSLSKKKILRNQKPTSNKTVKRGKGGQKSKSKYSKSSLTIVGNNVAGINGKIDSLNGLIEALGPGVILLQETKLYNQGKVKLPGFVIFEKLRKYAGGGGLMTAVHENLNPMLIEEDDEDTEILTVDISYQNISIRTINAYAPQEYVRKKGNKDSGNEESERKEENRKFFLKLQTEIQNAKNTENLICIQLDANSKFGKEIIKEDPAEKMSENGKLLYEIIKSENLVLVNSTEKCEGTITRHRKTKKSTEKSVLDYFIVCRRLFEILKKMKIDEDRSMVLTKYATKKVKKF